MEALRSAGSALSRGVLVSALRRHAPRSARAVQNHRRHLRVLCIRTLRLARRPQPSLAGARSRRRPCARRYAYSGSPKRLLSVEAGEPFKFTDQASYDALADAVLGYASAALPYLCR